FAFRVERRPNPHLAFGVGEHFCMGAHVARVEIEIIFRHLLARLEWFEPSGPVQRLRSAVNGGLKHLPLRYRLSSRGSEAGLRTLHEANLSPHPRSSVRPRSAVRGDRSSMEILTLSRVEA